MPDNRIVSLDSPEEILKYAVDAARQQALTGAIDDDTQDDYNKELGQTAVPPLLMILIREIRQLRADLWQIEENRRTRKPA